MKKSNTINEKKNKKLQVEKKVNNSVEDTNEIKAFVIIVVIITAIIVAIYGLTELIKEDEPANNVTPGVINYDVTTVGTLLNRPYDEYFVLIYRSDDDNAPVYSAILSNYMQKSSLKDYKKIYYCDLDNKLNSEYYNVNNDNKSNPSAQKIEELDFGPITLLSIKKGKINKYSEDINIIKELLK